MTHAFSGVITLDGLSGRDVLVASLSETDSIQLEFMTGDSHQTYRLAFDDAEHLAALLLDFALISRDKAGVGRTQVE